MDRAGGGRHGGGKKGAKRPRPEGCKLGVSPNFELAVKGIIRDWARSDDMHDLERQLFADFANFRTIGLALRVRCAASARASNMEVGCRLLRPPR
jgi:hypothetical protein